ncbi:MAG TPA: biotin--[acetyl-CoA-carboxylase] ligase [Acidimicrobiales bacterium]|nr:biotin--[acetyl-CoA-carboxylase] ligase [Acidimicrobiales bacterium]
MSGAEAEARYEAEPGPVGTRFTEVRHFAELDSTNRYLADLARSAPRPGLVAVADHQTAGRGRLGRRWEAPPGTNLLVSVLLVPMMPVEALHLCSVAVALAAADACRQATGLDPGLKWPNDLVTGDRKLGGILSESVPLDSGSRAVVVGLGLNVGWPSPDGEAGAAEVPDELRTVATSIWRETGTVVQPGDVLAALLTQLEPRLVALDDAEGRARMAGEYRGRCSTLSRPVRVVLPHGETAGTAVDITTEGHLIVDVGPCFVTVSAGDVVHVHPGG